MTAVAALGVLPQRIATAVAGVFGLLTVVLVGVGLYGTIAFDVGRRTREIGVRMALGADRRRLVGRVLRDTLGLTAPGFAIGGVAAYGIGRVAEAFLLGVSSADPLAFGAVGLLILTVVLFAAFDPAWRASRVDPAEALRHE
jgi:putative ABC transport system permease protein